MCKIKNTRFPAETQDRASRRMAFLFLCLFIATIAFAQAPAGYYAAAENKSGYALRVALHNIIKNHTTLSYNNLWQSFYTTDKRPDNGKVWDMYSDRPGNTPAYYFTFGSDQCGNYSGEGDCYNREHSVPKSWFGGSVAPMYSDLFHLVPTDGYVNSKRSNLPFGKVTSATWTSTNGSKVGTSNISGYSGQVFEPIDSFKGDFARIYFYMAVCYMDKNLGVETQSNFSGGNLKPWSKQLLLQWTAMDPVSKTEIMLSGNSSTTATRSSTIQNSLRKSSAMTPTVLFKSLFWITHSPLPGRYFPTPQTILLIFNLLIINPIKLILN